METDSVGAIVDRHGHIAAASGTGCTADHAAQRIDGQPRRQTTGRETQRITVGIAGEHRQTHTAAGLRRLRTWIAQCRWRVGSWRTDLVCIDLLKVGDQRRQFSLIQRHGVVCSNGLAQIGRRAIMQIRCRFPDAPQGRCIDPRQRFGSAKPRAAGWLERTNVVQDVGVAVGKLDTGMAGRAVLALEYRPANRRISRQ